MMHNLKTFLAKKKKKKILNLFKPAKARLINKNQFLNSALQISEYFCQRVHGGVAFTITFHHSVMTCNIKATNLRERLV